VVVRKCVGKKKAMPTKREAADVGGIPPGHKKKSPPDAAGGRGNEQYKEKAISLEKNKRK